MFKTCLPLISRMVTVASSLFFNPVTYTLKVLSMTGFGYIVVDDNKPRADAASFSAVLEDTFAPGLPGEALTAGTSGFVSYHTPSRYHPVVLLGRSAD